MLNHNIATYSKSLFVAPSQLYSRVFFLFWLPIEQSSFCFAINRSPWNFYFFLSLTFLWDSRSWALSKSYLENSCAYEDTDGYRMRFSESGQHFFYIDRENAENWWRSHHFAKLDHTLLTKKSSLWSLTPGLENKIFLV